MLQQSQVTKYNRYPEIFRMVKKIFPNPENVLSFGCSTGEEVQTLKNIYFPSSNIYGTDIKPLNEKWFIPDIQKTSKIFDIIFAMSVLCHTIDDSGHKMSFNEFESIVTLLDSKLGDNGLLVLYNTKYLLSETKYDYQCLDNLENGFVVKYHKDEQKVKDEQFGNIFRK